MGSRMGRQRDNVLEVPDDNQLHFLEGKIERIKFLWISGEYIIDVVTQKGSVGDWMGHIQKHYIEMC